MILCPVPALQNKVDSYALNTLSTTDTDFDGDEIYLEDIWQQTIHVPKVRTIKLLKGGMSGLGNNHMRQWMHQKAVWGTDNTLSGVRYQMLNVVPSLM